MHKEILRLEKACVTINGANVIDHLRLIVQTGEIHSIISQRNRDLFYISQVVNGYCQLNSGYILFDNSPIVINSPTHASSLGIHNINNESKLIPNLSIAQNLFALNSSSKFITNNKHYQQRCNEIFALFNLKFSPQTPIYRLNKNELTIIELVKAYICKAKIILIEDVFSNYTPVAFSQFSRIVNLLKEKNISFILLSHTTQPSLQLADRLTIIRDNTNAGNFLPEDFHSERIHKIIFGSKFKDAYHYTTHKTNIPTLCVNNFPMPGIQKGLTTCIHRGEIFGIFDIANYISDASISSIFKVCCQENVRISLDGKSLHLKNMPSAIKSNIAFFHNQIENQSLFNNLTIGENIALISENIIGGNLLGSYRKDAKSMQIEFSENYSIPLNYMVCDLTLIQKYYLILFKWFILSPKVLIGFFPFSQIDDLTKNSLYPQIEKIAKKGTSILLISSNASELASLCDNILVVYKDQPYKLFTNIEFRSLQIDDLF